MTNQIFYYIISILIILLIYSYKKNYTFKKENSKLIASNNELKGKISEYEIEINTKNQKISTLDFYTKKLLKKVKKDKKEYKHIFLYIKAINKYNEYLSIKKNLKILTKLTYNENHILTLIREAIDAYRIKIKIKEKKEVKKIDDFSLFDNKEDEKIKEKKEVEKIDDFSLFDSTEDEKLKEKKDPFESLDEFSFFDSTEDEKLAIKELKVED